MEILYNLTWLQLVILMLASFRLTHLIVYDKITSFLRAPFVEEKEEMAENGEIYSTVHIKGSGLRYWIGSLLVCHWCVGIWSTAAIVLIYAWFPAVYPLLVILAVAGGASFLESKI